MERLACSPSTAAAWLHGYPGSHLHRRLGWYVAPCLLPQRYRLRPLAFPPPHRRLRRHLPHGVGSDAVSIRVKRAHLNEFSQKIITHRYWTAGRILFTFENTHAAYCSEVRLKSGRDFQETCIIMVGDRHDLPVAVKRRCQGFAVVRLHVPCESGRRGRNQDGGRPFESLRTIGTEAEDGSQDAERDLGQATMLVGPRLEFHFIRAFTTSRVVFFSASFPMSVIRSLDYAGAVPPTATSATRGEHRRATELLLPQYG